MKRKTIRACVKVKVDATAQPHWIGFNIAIKESIVVTIIIVIQSRLSSYCPGKRRLFAPSMTGR